MNILTFDIEEWFIEKQFDGARSEKYQEFDRYLNKILDLLDETKTRATFFCLGKIATDFPCVVKSISERGHEIGCHSNTHLWLTQMTPEQLRTDTHDAIAALQDVAGQKVVSYRAPAFSIGEQNKWALEILASEGIERDASIFPAKRDFGGFDSFPTASPTIISYNGVRLKEFPICLASLLGKRVAYSGGGYFRMFPYRLIRKLMKENEYVMTYFHIGDFLQNKGGLMSKSEYEEYFKEAGTLKNRLARYVKSNLGTSSAFDKMAHMVNSLDFMSLVDADEMHDWSDVQVINL